MIRWYSNDYVLTALHPLLPFFAFCFVICFAFQNKWILVMESHYIYESGNNHYPVLFIGGYSNLQATLSTTTKMVIYYMMQRKEVQTKEMKKESAWSLYSVQLQCFEDWRLQRMLGYSGVSLNWIPHSDMDYRILKFNVYVCNVFTYSYTCHMWDHSLFSIHWKDLWFWKLCRVCTEFDLGEWLGQVWSLACHGLHPYMCECSHSAPLAVPMIIFSHLLT